MQEKPPRPLPRLREDLTWSRRDARGEEVWFLKDPVRRTYFRFSGAVAYVLRGLDGTATAEAVRQGFQAQFGDGLSAEELETVVGQAAKLGLLTRAAAAGRAQGAHSNDVRAGGVRTEDIGTEEPSSEETRREPLLARLLHLQLAAFDPDALLTWLEARLRLLFTPAVFWAWTGLVGAGLVTVAGSLRALALEADALIRWETILLLLPVLLVVTVLHEVGHGVTCKHFGGEVREMGFLLIYFQPAMYCDISDAWMLDRRARLWSVAAGTWVQLAVWGLSALAWRVTAPETLLHAAALLVVLVAGAGAVMNLIPFLKLDGYYFLSDWLEVPNLRARAFAHLRRFFLGALGARGESARGPALRGEGDGVRYTDSLPAQDGREARIFLTYGLSAGLLSSALLLYLLLAAHGFTARHLGAGCVALLWLFAAGILARPAGALAAPVGRAWADVLRRPRFSRASSVLLILAAAVAALFLVKWELRVSAEVRFEPLERAVVRSEIDGIVERVAVHENQQVAAGEVLFELSAREYRAALEQAEAELQKAQAELTLLTRGARAEEIRNAEGRVDKALTREEYARRDHAKSQELYERKIIPLKDLLAAEEELVVRQKEVKEARGLLDLVRAGSRPEEIERTRAEVARLTSLARVARENLDRAQVRSPIGGRVLTPRPELLLGQRLERGAALIEVVDARRLRAEVEVPESEAAEVRTGQRVKIKARGYPGRSFWGEVVSVASAAEADPAAERAAFLPGAQSRIRVHTELDNAEGLLKPEMTGNAKIYCGSRPLVELLTRRLVRYVRTEFWF